MNLATAIQMSLARESPGEPPPPGDRITWEIVQALTPDGRAVINGISLSPSGTFVPAVGQRVPVLWKDGAPLLILGDRVRRAQFPPVRRVTAQGIIEELSVGRYDGKDADVWYRNYERFERLDIRRSLAGHEPQQVKWRLDGKGFGVACAQGWWAVFQMERDPTDVEARWEPKRTWLGQPLGETTTVLSVMATASHQYLDYYGYCEENQVHTWHPEWDTPGYALATSGEYLDELQGGGMASGARERTFSLADLFSGAVLDDLGHAGLTAALGDWFVDSSGHLQLVVLAQWEDFSIESPNGSGERTRYVPDGEVNGQIDNNTEYMSSTGARYVIGATKQSDESTLGEQHLLIYDATAGGATFSTFLPGSNIGSVTREVSWQTNIGYELITYEGGPQAGERTWGYGYGGDSASPLSEDKPTRSVDLAPNGSFPTGNATGQLFRADLALVPGPYTGSSQTGSGSGGVGHVFAGWWNFYWTAATFTGTEARLWFYRVQAAQFFQANDEARLFVVMERYPFVAGTGYINDIPQIGVFVVDLAGTILRTLRSFQYGLQGAALLDGNAHRIVWTLSAPWLNPRATAYVTALDAAIERAFTPAQLQAWSNTQGKLLSPDFLWAEAPPDFFRPGDLPTLAEDGPLKDFAALFPAEQRVSGSVRAANNQELLSPLDRYLPS